MDGVWDVSVESLGEFVQSSINTGTAGPVSTSGSTIGSTGSFYCTGSCLCACEEEDDKEEHLVSSV